MLTMHKSQKSLFSITHSICVGGLKILVSFELFQEIAWIIGRINSRAVGTAGSVMIIGFAKKKTVWREKTRLTGPKVRVAAISKDWHQCDSGRAFFCSPHSRKQKKVLLTGASESPFNNSLYLFSSLFLKSLYILSSCFTSLSQQNV